MGLSGTGGLGLALCTGVPYRERAQRAALYGQEVPSPSSFFSLSGFAHLPSGLYPSYLHLNHLEPPSSGSPLLSQLGQPSIFDTQKGEVGWWGRC